MSEARTAKQPHVAGASVVLTVTGASIALALVGALQRGLFLALPGGIAVATVGFVNDRRTVSLVVHVAAGVWAVARLGIATTLINGSRVAGKGTEGLRSRS